MKSFEKVLSKPFVKILINFISPIVIGELVSAIIDNIKNNQIDRKFWILSIFLLISVIAYVICIFKYYRMDEKTEAYIKQTENEN